MSKPNEWVGGKGPDSRVSNMRAYWDSELWDNLKKNKKDEEPQADLYNPNRFLFLDDLRNPENAWIHDENKKLQQVSGIANFKWDVVRSYDEFVEYVEKYGIPQVVSFDNDLIDCQDSSVSTEDLVEMYSMMNWKESKYKTGAHCADWLCKLCVERQHPLPKYYVHSANAAARPVIKSIMETARPLIKH